MTAQRILLINEDGTAEVNGVKVRVVPENMPLELQIAGMRESTYDAMLSAAAIDLSGLPVVHSEWKYDGKLARYHPQASHVTPDFRDGWNAALDAIGVTK